MTGKGRGDAKGEHTTLKGGLNRLGLAGLVPTGGATVSRCCHAINPRQPCMKGRAGCEVYC